MNMWLTNDEQYRFIQTLRMDNKFRDEIHNLLTGGPYLTQGEMIDRMADDISNEIRDQIKEQIDDTAYDIKQEIMNEWEEDVIRLATVQVRDDLSELYDQMSKEIKEDIVNHLARKLLDEEAKKIIKKKVEEKMLKVRSYRSDLLDLDD
ncbi:MAG: hypothetical protein J7L15_06585 [Clostridiales bacterium]|nr:hypothetical protein [Clostridiales bacterium]